RSRRFRALLSFCAARDGNCRVSLEILMGKEAASDAVAGKQPCWFFRTGRIHKSGLRQDGMRYFPAEVDAASPAGTLRASPLAGSVGAAGAAASPLTGAASVSEAAGATSSA